jgi:hypothetical protein
MISYCDYLFGLNLNKVQCYSRAFELCNCLVLKGIDVFLTGLALAQKVGSFGESF